MASKAWMVLGCLAALYTYGDALQCYDCYFFEYDTNNFILGGLLDATNALADKNCKKEGQDFLDNPSKSLTCAAESYCQKTFVNYDQDIFGSKVGVKLFSRGCGSKSDPNYGGVGCAAGNDLMKYWPEQVGQTNRGGVACGCEEDLCNGSNQVVIGSIVLIISALLAIMI